MIVDLWRRSRVLVITILTMGISAPARADFWGGDLALLAQVVTNTAQQLTQLRSILGNGKDTLGLLQDVNRGIKDAMTISRTLNRTLQPGVLSDLRSVEGAMQTVERLYGRVPQGAGAQMQRMTDRSVAEALHLHNEAFRYADRVDPEAERIKDYSRSVNPQGAGRLTAQSLGVLITVMNQVLRTNAAMVKLQGEQLALQNRRQKAESEQFKVQYGAVSSALRDLRPTYDLPSVVGH